MTDQLITTPLIAAPTADGYRAALKTLTAVCRAFLDAGCEDYLEMVRLARAMDGARRAHDLQPRERMTRTEVFHNRLRMLVMAIDEYVDAEHLSGGVLGLDPWEPFDREVRGAERVVDSSDDASWAPEDDSNPVKTSLVPVPDPAAPPVVGDLRQGDWVKSRYDEQPRQILTGVEDHEPFGASVRLSDPKDGTWFGGHWLSPKLLAEYERVEAPDA